MKRIKIIVIILLLSKVALCQPTTFSKVFGSDSSLLYGGVSITSYNDSIYFSMFDQDQPVNYQAMTFVKTDPNGNQCLNDRFYEPEYYFSAGSIKMTSDGYLICGGNSGSLIIRGNSSSFFKFNRITLDTIFVKYFSQGDISDFYGCEELSDGGYLFSGQAEDTLTQNNWAWMLKTDSGGHEVWRKELSSDQENIAVGASSFYGGLYQLWGTGHPNTLSGNPADSAIFIDKYDNNGNLIWRDTFGIVGNDNIGGPIIGIREGGGIAVINALDTSNPSNGTLLMPLVVYKFDTNGNILWQHYFPAAPEFKAANSILETRSGSIVICGAAQSGFVSSDTIGHGNGAIFKLDKNGNLIFLQYYNYDSTWQDVLLDMTETSDGGYACIGDAYEHIGNTNYERAWLLKVDSNGCLNGDCPTLYTGIKPIADLANFFVFPNPATSVFTVALAGPNDINGYNDLHFTLYDLTGRLVMDQLLKEQTTLLHRDDLTSGMYLWQIADNNKALSNGKLVLR